MDSRMLERIAQASGSLTVETRFEDRGEVRIRFPATNLMRNLAVFEGALSIGPHSRNDESVHNSVLKLLVDSAVSVLENEAGDVENFWTSYSIGMLWLYLNDLTNAQEHHIVILDQILSEGDATVVVTNSDRQVTFGVSTYLSAGKPAAEQKGRSLH